MIRRELGRCIWNRRGKSAEKEARSQSAEVKPTKCVQTQWSGDEEKEVSGSFRQATTPTKRIRKVQINYNNQHSEHQICTRTMASICTQVLGGQSLHGDPVIHLQPCLLFLGNTGQTWD